jgi:antitoxin component of RelBE/YafQ-DinJ toxin-antitoxin module
MKMVLDLDDEVKETAASIMANLNITPSKDEIDPVDYAISLNDPSNLNVQSETDFRSLLDKLHKKHKYGITKVVEFLGKMDSPMAQNELISIMKKSDEYGVDVKDARNILNAGRKFEERHVTCPNCYKYLGIAKDIKIDYCHGCGASVII